MAHRDPFEADLSRIKRATPPPLPNGPDPGDPDEAVWIWHGDKPPEPPPMSVKGLLPMKGPVIVAGQRSMGKSTVAADLGVSLSAGITFAGLDVMRKGGTAWFATEGESEFWPRIEALVSDRLLPLGDACPVNPRRLPIAFTRHVPALGQASNLDNYLRRLEAVQRRMRSEYGCDLASIVFDTWTTAAQVEKAGDAVGNDAVMSRVRRIGDTFGVPVLSLDHMGKDTSLGTRDSSAKEAAADSVLYVLGEKNENGTITSRRLVLDKLRAGPSGLILPFEIVAKPVADNSEGIGIPRWLVHPEAGEDGGPKPRDQKPGRRKIADGPMTALRALAVAIDEAGKTKTSPYVPTGVRLVSMTLWRTFHDTRSTAPDSHAKNEAFRRAGVALTAEGLIEVNGPDVWITSAGEAVLRNKKATR